MKHTVCARCRHAWVDHGDRAIILCMGGWSRDRSTCYCTGYAETLAELNKENDNAAIS